MHGFPRLFRFLPPWLQPPSWRWGGAIAGLGMGLLAGALSLGLAGPGQPAIAAPTPPSPTPAATAPADSPDPAALFEQHCAGCHVNGGNIIRRGKNLKARAMARNGVDSVAAVADIITHGKGLMSAYGDRLTPAELERLAAYVWDRSQENWR